MGNKTALYEEHLAAEAKVVDFGGWDMPLNYGSQIAEHQAVRAKAGMFDVSHMTVVDVAGAQAKAFLQRLLANNIGKLKEPGRALYSVMLNADGGIVDDLIVYRRDDRYTLIVNCATRAKDLAWMEQVAQGIDCVLTERDDLAIIAVQGPTALAAVVPLLPAGAEAIVEAKPFQSVTAGNWLIGRTGYTGEDGVEIVLPHSAAVELWRALAAKGVAPAGLAARDTLRLEAGLCLYGQDMDETTSPYESNLAWTVSMRPPGRQFVGRKALEAQLEAGSPRQLTGIVLEGKGIMRHDQKVHLSADADSPSGVITSGIFSPSLGYSIGLARVPVDWSGPCFVGIRNKLVAARLVAPPFVRNGQKVFD